jgi:hypothetical protein
MMRSRGLDLWFGRRSACDTGSGRFSGRELWRAFRAAGPARDAASSRARAQLRGISSR